MCDRFPSLAAKRKATEIATASIAKYDKEEQVLKHLLDLKPNILGCGQEIWLDTPHIEEYIEGYIEKLRRHGLHDRSSRLAYLQSVLRKKWSDKPKQFLTIMGFLLEMRIDPERQYNQIELNNCEYSTIPGKSSTISEKLCQEQLKKEILEEIALELEQIREEQGGIQSTYDSDLSDWESCNGDEDDKNEMENLLKKDINNRHTGSTIEKTNLQTQNLQEATLITRENTGLDPEALKRNWQNASRVAISFLQENIRQIQHTPLNSQPVISSLLDLHLLFGQFWEWKKSHTLYRSSPKLEIVNESDIIREILWQFTHPSSLSSPTFIYDWRLSPSIMISTLSQSTLRSIVNKYGKIISIIEDIKGFIQQIQNQPGKLSYSSTQYDNQNDDDDNNQNENTFIKIPKLFQDLAQCLSEILLHISNYIGSLENEFFRSKLITTTTTDSYKFYNDIKSNGLNNNHQQQQKTENVTTNSTTSTMTLLQMDKKLQYPVLLLEALANVLNQSVGDLKIISKTKERRKTLERGDSGFIFEQPPWFLSIKVISALEMSLITENRINIWRILLFIFSRCLHSFLHDYFAPLETNNLEFSDYTNSLLVRNPDLNISDGNFWSSAIKIQPYIEKLGEIGIKPLSCLEKICPKMLTILKTCEMLRQLTSEEISTVIMLGTLPPTKKIIQKFLSIINPNINFFHYNQQKSPSPPIHEHHHHHNIFKQDQNNLENINKNVPDYKKYFNFLPLNDSRVLQSFDSILKMEILSNNNNNRNKDLCNEKDEDEMLKSSNAGFLSLANFLKIDEIPYVTIHQILPQVLEKFISPVYKRCEESLWNILKDYRVDKSLGIFREIILGGREDFAQAIVKLAQINSSRFVYEDPRSRDPTYQKLLFDCYPDGREGFDIEFRLDPKSDMNCKFIVTPKFPLNLILSTRAIEGYLNVSKQLHRIRKSLWTVTNLSMKECKTIEGVEVKRAFLFRFSLIHFCSSLRAFFMLKVFTNDAYTMTKFCEFHDDDQEGGDGKGLDLDHIIKKHDDYVHRIELNLLKIKLMDTYIIKRMIMMSEGLGKCWRTGISMKVLIALEDCLNKCWSIVNDFSRSGLCTEFNELYYHLGPPPAYL